MDGNGKLDDYEFICGLALFTKTTVDHKIEAVFEVFDVDKSLTIDKKEFAVLVETIMKLNNKSVTEAEMKAKMESLKQQYFRLEDYVTMNSFSKMVKEDDDLRKAMLDKGIFGPKELDLNQYDEDLENELGKYKFEEEGLEEGDQAVPGGLMQSLDGEGGFEMEEVGGGDQFMAIKPWEGTVRNTVPDGWKPKASDGDIPDASLSLQYVHGYRCHDTRNNIFYTPEGKLVYHTALVGIQLDTKTNKQMFVTDNIDDIMSMACYGNLCATGDIGPKPALVIWDNVTMKSLQVYSGDLTKGIAMLAFSFDGKLLACTCMDPDKMVYVFDVEKLIAGKRKGRL